MPDLVTNDAIHAFIYGLKPWLKGFVKVQAQAMTDDASLNEVMTVVLKLEENHTNHWSTMRTDVLQL